MKLFDFGAFQLKKQMPSHDEILLQMLILAFHITSLVRIFYVKRP